MSAHTPGPWCELGSAVGVAWRGQGGEQDQLIPVAMLPRPDPNDSMDEWRANAKLLAAAPELLEALKALVAEYEPNLKTFALDAPRRAKWLNAQAVIAKAEAA